MRAKMKMTHDYKIFKKGDELTCSRELADEMLAEDVGEELELIPSRDLAPAEKSEE